MKRIKLFEEFVRKGVEDTRPQKTLTRDEERDTLAELNEMTLGQLERIEDYAEMIADRMGEGQELESWMFAEITQALNGLNSVHDAMDGNDGVKEKVLDKLKKESVNEATDIYEDGGVSITRFAAGGGRIGYQITKRENNYKEAYIVLTAEEFRALLSSAKNLIATGFRSVKESAMSDIHIMAQEAKDFKSFVKAFTKEHHDLSSAGEPDQFEAWLKSIYDSAKESMEESKII